MFVLPLPIGYLVAMLIWLVVLAALFYGLLRYRQRCRRLARRLWLSNAGLSLAMLLAVFTAGELGFACFADFSDTFNITNVSKRWLVLHIDKERNNEGFRDREPFTKFIAPGKQRIVFLGDSFTAGHGIKNIDDRFTDRIAAWLEAKQPGKYVVANLGEPGYEASQIEGLAKALLLSEHKSDVNMIVYIYNINDIEGYDSRTQDSLREIMTAEPRNPLFVTPTCSTGFIFGMSSSASRKGRPITRVWRSRTERNRGRGCGPSWPSFIGTVSRHTSIIEWSSFPSCRIWARNIPSARPTPSSSRFANRRRPPCSIWNPCSASTRGRISL